MHITQAAKKIGVHPNTLRSLEKRGIISPNRNWAGHRIFSEEDVQEILEKLFPGKTHKDGTSDR